MLFKNKVEEPRKIVERELEMFIERFKLKSDIRAQEEDKVLWKGWGFGSITLRRRQEQVCVWNLPDPY